MTILLDAQATGDLEKVVALNPQIRTSYIYEALLLWALDTMPARLTTARPGLKIPQGMTLQLRPEENDNLGAAPPRRPAAATKPKTQKR